MRLTETEEETASAHGPRPPILRENAYRRDSDIRVRYQYFNPFGQLGTYLTIKLQVCRSFVVLRVVNNKFRLWLQRAAVVQYSCFSLSTAVNLQINLCDQPCSVVSRLNNRRWRKEGEQQSDQLLNILFKKNGVLASRWNLKRELLKTENYASSLWNRRQYNDLTCLIISRAEVSHDIARFTVCYSLRLSIIQDKAFGPLSTNLVLML